MHFFFIILRMGRMLRPFICADSINFSLALRLKENHGLLMLEVSLSHTVTHNSR